MSALLKAGDRAAQRLVNVFAEDGSLHWPPPGASTRVAPAVPDEPVKPEKMDEISHLCEKLAQMSAELERCQADAKQAEAEAFERGLTEGEARADEAADSKLQLLSANAEAAQKKLAVHLDKLEELALHLSSRALEKVFGAQEHFPRLVADSIRNRHRQLSAELVIGIRVSAADFPDADALAALSRSMDRSDIVADRQLPSGACIVDLKLGHFDIGIGSQWERLRAFLDSLQDESEAE